MILGSKTIRFVIFSSTIIIAAIVLAQLFWLQKLYRFEEKEFDHNIARLARGLNEDMRFEENADIHLNKFISKQDPSTFSINIHTPVNTDSLRFYLQHELEDQEIFTDCYAGIFDSISGNYVKKIYLKSATSKIRTDLPLPPALQKSSHIILFFPYRTQYLLSRMEFWIGTSILLLLVLVLFGGSLYYFYKQKFQNEIQREFVHNFTHEFKTPVSVISLAAETLQKPSTRMQPEKVERYAAIVEKQTHHLQRQIERLLQHASTEAGQLQMQMEPVDMHDLIRDAAANLAPLIEEKKAVIHYRLDAKKHVVRADREHMRIVFINLLDNALKYSNSPDLVISTQEHEGTFRFSVEDNGQGIPKKELQRIFRKFYRVMKDNVYASKGFGIGLSFVKQIVTAHHGAISVDSVEGRGSIFKVDIPY